MPLQESCEELKSKLLFVLPVVGYGWCVVRPDKPLYQPGEPTEPPSPFRVRISEFHRHDGKLQGGMGRVEEMDHPLNNQWAAFCVRDGMGHSVHNFCNLPAEFTMRIGNAKPVIDIQPEVLPMPEWMQFGDVKCLSGLGYVVETPMTLQRVHELIAVAEKRAE